MCGIAGWLGKMPDSGTHAERMVRALGHRGPDAHGIRNWPTATLVHTRLSIIDLSPAGIQPMANEDDTIWVVFNGEIYNHRELRRTLEARGHVFRGHSDTEILPHLYEEHGPDFVEKLRGMFALAVYDCRTKTIILTRDRFGIKPLFYSVGIAQLVFASEIRAVLNSPGIDTTPDRQAVYDFTSLFYIPAPQTFYKGIRALQPGEILQAHFDESGLCYKTRSYHHWTIGADPSISFGQAVERSEQLIATAVSRQLQSDVAIGTLLSGGIDSSLVTAAAQKVAGSRLRTFNVRFDEQEYDETWAALAVAKHIGSNHTTLDIEAGQGSWSRITELLLHVGQPFTDTSLFAVNEVCRLMRRHLTVALSGDGGDEAFGGYYPFSQISGITRLQMLPRPFWSGAAITLLPLAYMELVPARLPHRLRELLASDDVSVIQGLSCWIQEREQRDLFPGAEKLLPTRRLFEPQWEYHLGRHASRAEWLSAYLTEIGVRLGLANDFLFKVDTASMKESLEIRVPMLDEDLFEFGLCLPHRLKVKGKMCKRVLRAVAERWLPSAVAHKPKKGFGIPVDRWADKNFKERLGEELLGPMSSLTEFFNPKAYRPIIEAFCEERSCRTISRQGLYQRAIMFLAVHIALTGERVSLS